MPPVASMMQAVGPSSTDATGRTGPETGCPVVDSTGSPGPGAAPMEDETGTMGLGALLPLLDMLPAAERVRVLAALDAAMMPVRS